MKLETTGWTFSGMTLTPSDALYQTLVEAVKSNPVTEKSLQKATGHLYRIDIDYEKQHIDFCPF